MKAAICLVALLLAACSEKPSPDDVPQPSVLTADAVGHFCGMIVAYHKGPKGQVFVTGRDTPLWFTSVRDTLAYTMLPEETAEARAIYVTDMASAPDWDSPQNGSWIPAQQALYVVGSSRRGGMGAQEVVPFSQREAAQAFADQYGGNVVAFANIPRDYVLGDAWPETGGQ